MLRDLTSGLDKISLRQGETVGQVIEALDRLYPGIQMRLCEEGTPRASMVVVDGLVRPKKLRQRLSPSSQVFFPFGAISGG